MHDFFRTSLYSSQSRDQMFPDSGFHNINRNIVNQYGKNSHNTNVIEQQCELWLM